MDKKIDIFSYIEKNYPKDLKEIINILKEHNITKKEILSKLKSFFNRENLNLNFVFNYFRNLENTDIDYVITNLHNLYTKACNNNHIFNISKIKNNEKYNKYLVPYPSLNDKNFEEKIYNKKEFNYHMQPDISKKSFEDFCKINKKKTLLPHQRFLKNYISIETPYNGLLVFHGTGSGKTCTAVSIAEGFIDLIKKNEYLEQRRVMVIYPGTSIQTNFLDTIYDLNEEKNEKALNLHPGSLQCTGNKYYIDNDDLSNDDKERYYKRKKENNYEIIGKQEFTNLVNNIKDNSQKKFSRNNNLFIEELRNEISKYFSNRIIIIDEIHNMKQTDIKDEKRPIDALKLVIEFAKNIKLVFMSATPMFDKPTEIVDLINLFLLNDNRTLMEYKDIFEYRDGKAYDISINGYTILKNNIKGYISYLRGENPVSYPSKLDPDSPELKGLYKNNKMYIPKLQYDIDGEKLSKDNFIKYTKLVKCEMSNYQFKFYNYYYYVIDKKDVAHKIGQELCNIIYPIDRNENSKYGTVGFNNAFTKLKERQLYEYKSFNQGFLKEENLEKYSVKYYQILQNIKKSPGIAFVYFDYIEIGVITMCMILEEAGYEPYKGKPFLNTKVTKKICSICNRYKDDSIHKLGHKDYHEFKQAKFLYLTDYHYNIVERQNLVKLTKSENNANGEMIKIILGTSVLKEGVDFYNIRQIHLGDLWHNMSKIRQIIGRGSRFCSHKFLPKQERNVTIFRYCTSMPSKCSMKDELICKRETVNEKMWKDAEMKDIIIKKVERILKENSIDCLLNKNVNYFDSRFKENADTDYSAECDYMKCNYKCANQNLIKNSKIDETTITQYFIEEDINLIIDSIIDLFNEKHYYKLNEIISKININNKTNIKLIFIALSKLIGKDKEKYPIIFENNQNVKGYIIYRSEYYVFQPINIYEKEMPIQFREYRKYSNNISIPIEIDTLNLMKKKKKKTKNVIDPVDEIINKLEKYKNIYEINYYFDHFINTDNKILVVEYILKKLLKNNQDKSILSNIEKLILEYSNFYTFEENIKNKNITGHFIKDVPRCYDPKVKDFIECELDIIRNIEFIFDFDREDAEIIGYLERKNNNIKFKIIDNTEVRGKVRQDSKIAKNTLPTGKVCETYDKQNLEKFCKILNLDIDKSSRSLLCKDIEIQFRKFEDKKIDNKKWFYRLEEWESKVKMEQDKISQKTIRRKRSRRTNKVYKLKYKLDIKKFKNKKKNN